VIAQLRQRLQIGGRLILRAPPRREERNSRKRWKLAPQGLRPAQKLFFAGSTFAECPRQQMRIRRIGEELTFFH